MQPESQARLRSSPYRERRKIIIVVAVLAIITGLFETATIVTIVAFIEGVTSGRSKWEVTPGNLDFAFSSADLVLIGAVALLAMTLCQLLSSWIQARSLSNWQYQLRMRSVRAYMGAGWAEQSSETSGSLQNLMALSAASAQGLRGMMSLLTAAGTLVIFTSGAFLASPLAAGTLVSTGIALMLALRPIRSAARQATHAASLAQRDVTERVDEIHGLAQEIRVNGARSAVESRINSENKVLRRAGQRAAVLSSLGNVFYRTLGLAFVLTAAAFASSQSDIDVARVGVAGLLLLRSLSYGQAIQNAVQLLQNNRPYAEQVNEALDRYEAATPKRGNLEASTLGEIELKAVSYTYRVGGPAALEGLDVSIAQGETIGIVGPSGSGKSTLVQILLGLREPTSGSYWVGGVPAMEIADEAWSRLVSVVPQQPKLLRATVLENIVFYRPWIGVGDAQQASIAAGLHDEIMALPQGYETPIGDAIRDLSGGQRQRLGIARALAGKPQLLVLDEPTSALDAMSEQRIQNTLAGLKGEVTVVIIAHRLATLNHCDRLLVLEAGSLTASGTPKIVMEQSEFYRAAVTMQLITAGDDEV